MITYSWKNIEISCHHRMYNKTNVAFAYTAILLATDSDGNSKEKKVSGGLGVPGDNFIDYSGITKEIAVNWIEKYLGANLDKLKNELESELTIFKILKFE